MKQLCRRVQQTLGELGPPALQDDQAAQLHLEGCDECFGVLESMVRLDEAFDVMPALDASDELVEQLLARDELQIPVTQTTLPAAPSSSQPSTSPISPMSWGAVLKDGLGRIIGPSHLRLKASMALAVVTLISVSFFTLHRSTYEAALDQRLVNVEVVEVQVDSLPGSALSGEFTGGVQPEVQSELRALGYRGGGAAEGQASEELGEKTDAPSGSRPTASYSLQFGPPPPPPPPLPTPPSVSQRIAETPMADGPRSESADSAPRVHDEVTVIAESMVVDQSSAASSSPVEFGDEDSLSTWGGSAADISYRGGAPRTESEQQGAFDSKTREHVRKRLDHLQRSSGKDQAADGRQNQDLDQDKEETVRRLRKEAKTQVEEKETWDKKVSSQVFEVEEAPAEIAKPRSKLVAKQRAEKTARLQAQAFLAERERIEGLSFQPATGYWSNTYVPGDPVLRYLQAQLAGRDRSAFDAVGDVPLLLHDASRRTTQPFDPPTDAALAVVLNADRRGVRASSRLLLQVGLVGTERQGGRRPGMNVALVVDLRGTVSAEAAANLRALILALGEARDLGDRFRLIVAGPTGGEILGPGDFKHGPLTVAIQQLFLAAGVESSGQSMELVDAVRMAFERVGRHDDPSAPLGSSTVLVATPGPRSTDLSTLVEMAHAGAVAGIPLSVVGVGDAVRITELDRLALAGQGNRRLMRQPTEARALVDRELSAVARVVARAVRLRIGLAPGVRLVDIIGSRRFGEADAEKVRRAERSIDQRLARNLGIEADRGDDEPGIQIVLPTFYAGDRHVILLDLVVPGPGPVAEVTARFKDLAYLGNGVAQASLDLPRRTASRGPLELNVLENHLAQRLRGVLDEAGQEVASGQRQAAHDRLAEHRQLLVGLGQELRGFHKDRDLMRDIAMLDEYLGLLGASAAPTEEQRLHLAESLRYAARLKVLPAPQPMGG